MLLVWGFLNLDLETDIFLSCSAHSYSGSKYSLTTNYFCPFYFLLLIRENGISGLVVLVLRLTMWIE